MSQMIEFTLPSSAPGRMLHAFRCVPEGEVRAIVQLSHGMVEFIDRYKPLAEYLAARGILVTGNDHLGHGGSIRTRADYGYFAEPDGNRAVLDDLHAMTVLTKKLYPGVPYFLLGHSMGSFYARQYLCEWGSELDGAIILGTGFQPKALVAFARTVCRVLAAMGGQVRTAADRVTVLPGPRVPTRMDARDIPDLVPVLAAVAAATPGVTEITGAARLRIKESDRLTAIADGIRRLGGKVEELPDGLILTGVPALSGGKAEGYNDHRIVMALSIAALCSQTTIELTDAQSICKSYPNFFDDYNRLGGQAHVI